MDKVIMLMYNKENLDQKINLNPTTVKPKDKEAGIYESNKLLLSQM
ncbi:MAG: hypothetical protein QM644_02725 [Mobilitalea sp.]